MISDRYVKWSDEALDFFKSSADKSVVLDVVISYACASQTGEGFADLVNSLNSEEVKRKIKKVVITDTCCLYRHCISGFDKYLDANVPTVWFLTNKDAIGRIECEIEMKSWSDGIKGEEFEYWHKKMLTDFAGDENGNGAIREFRDKVIEEAAVAAYKGNSELSGCIDFMLEECAYVCAHFKNNPIFVYPMRLARPMTNAIERYNMSVTHLPYKTSKQSQKSCKKVSNLDSDRIDKEVALFMKERVSNVNFFVIDKYGNHIYKNYTLDRVIGDNNAKELGQKIWQTNAEVMRTREQIVCEEYYNGINYLSVKSPLIIDDEVIGIIGLALDITGQKKAQQLELKNKMQQVKIQEQQKLKVLAEQVAHDIRSPLMALDMLSRSHKNLSEKERGILASIATNVSDIANNLLNRYKKSDDEKNVEIDKKSRPILVNLALSEIISHKKYQYQKVNVQFNCLFGPKTSFIFINGNQSDFSRMTSNVINNAVEALEGKDGAIDINVRRNGAYVDVIIGDNGKGMPQETIDKILGNVFVGTAKEGGYGIGLNQIRDTLLNFDGTMSIQSKEGCGTEFTLSFPIAATPNWILEKLLLRTGDTVVILDDDDSVHQIWEMRFADYMDKINLVHFKSGREAQNFIASFKEKDKIILLSDYKLNNQDINGADVIDQSGLCDKSTLVTNSYNDRSVILNNLSPINKILPKSLISEVEIIVKDANNEAEESSSKQLVVIVDDNRQFTDSMIAFFENHRNVRVDAYSDAKLFLKNISKYSKDTKIIMDHDFKDNMNGFDLAAQLYEWGYTRLYMVSGKRFEKKEIPHYLTVLLKHPNSFEVIVDAV